MITDVVVPAVTKPRDHIPGCHVETTQLMGDPAAHIRFGQAHAAHPFRT